MAMMQYLLVLLQAIVLNFYEYRTERYLFWFLKTAILMMFFKCCDMLQPTSSGGHNNNVTPTAATLANNHDSPCTKKPNQLMRTSNALATSLQNLHETTSNGSEKTMEGKGENLD